MIYSKEVVELNAVELLVGCQRWLYRTEARWGLGRKYVHPRHPVSNFVLSTRGKTNEEGEGLQERYPANHNGALGGLDQLRNLFFEGNN